MSGFNFELYQKPISDVKTTYIQLQVGKGRKKQPSIYIDSDAFDCIRGVIWNKHREFADQKMINQINNDDWFRILKGFEEAMADLKESTESEQLIDILSLSKHLVPKIDLLFEQKDALYQFMQALTQWVEMHLKKEKYILIIQNDG